MAKQTKRAMPKGGTPWHYAPVTRALLRVGESDIEDVGGNRAVEIVEQHMQRIFELEAALDHYAWGPGPRGSLEPMRGDAYTKAVAMDGGRIARAALKERLDGEHYGGPNRRAPGGWGIAENDYGPPKRKQRKAA